MRTRFAPSPTGYLHLGHVANAIFTWGAARAFGAEVLLRLEDHDRGRFRAVYESAILDDLEWLGFEPHIAPVSLFRLGTTPYRQSDNAAAYIRALRTLSARAHVYACDCSRQDILARGGGGRGELRYDGYCRSRNLLISPGLGIRVELPAATASFEDLWLGVQLQQPTEQSGDLLLRERNGNWTYQFCVVVDDLEQGVDLIVRGQDLLSSTGRQIMLGEMLGRATPASFLHHPLIRDAAGRKLSKREGDLSLAAWRAAGHTPDAVLGHCLEMLGFAPAQTRACASSAADCVAEACIARVKRSAAGT